MRCDTPAGAQSEQCVLMQFVTAEDRDNVGLTVIVLKTADKKARIMRILAPLGVLLPSGLGLKIDDTDMGRAGFVRCLPNGCVAEVILEDKLLDSLKSGKTATFIIFQTPEEGIGIPISLNGFGRASTRCRKGCDCRRLATPVQLIGRHISRARLSLARSGIPMTDSHSILDRAGLDPRPGRRPASPRRFEGADDGELYLEYSQSEGLVFDNGRLKSASFDTNQGFGLRAVAGEAAGYAHSGEISEPAIQRAADAVQAVKAGHNGTYAEPPRGTNARALRRRESARRARPSPRR